MENKFLSRKFFLTLVVLGLVGWLPIAYKTAGVSDTVSLMVLGILSAVGVAYGFVNLKEAKIELENKAKEIAGVKDAPASEA